MGKHGKHGHGHRSSSSSSSSSDDEQYRHLPKHERKRLKKLRKQMKKVNLQVGFDGSYTTSSFFAGNQSENHVNLPIVIKRPLKG